MKLTNEQIERILEGGSNALLVRHENTSRNKLLNQATCELSDVVNNHDPEVDVPIELGVWGCIDSVTAEIEKPLHEEILSLRQEVERLKERATIDVDDLRDGSLVKINIIDNSKRIRYYVTGVEYSPMSGITNLNLGYPKEQDHEGV